MPAKGEAKLEVGDILEGMGVRYRVTEIVRGSDELLGDGMWLARIDGQKFLTDGRYPNLTRKNGDEALASISPDKPLPDNWYRLSMHAMSDKSYADNYAHVISIAMRIALGHGLTVSDVCTITYDALAAYTEDADVVEDTSPITDQWDGNDGLQGISDQFCDTIAEAERYGATHDLIVTEFLLALGIRPGIWSDH